MPLIAKIILVGALGIGAQWLAWRYRLPAIVLLLAAGALVGPVTGLVDPVADFGEPLYPLISIAVAIILFEGGLTLKFSEIRGTSRAVRQLIGIGAPLGWLLGSLAAHYVAGLSWPAAVVLAGILVVTGPTVIMPLLRNARLAQRPAALLRWEAIVADPIGALFAVIAFEIIVVMAGEHAPGALMMQVLGAALLGLGGGFLIGRALIALFVRGLVPEFLKVPVILSFALIGYEISNLALEEAGLVTVTVAGLTLANSRLAALAELKRFKEIMTVMLVSTVFVVLTATLDKAALDALDLRAVAFILVMLLIVRPAVAWLSTLGAGLSVKERLLVGWIAPRGVVAVAVSGLFGAALADHGIADGGRLIPLTFAIVVATVILHGFSIGPLARWLGLASNAPSGVLIVGGSAWTAALAEKLKELEIPVTIVDRNWNHLKPVRQAGIAAYYGEVLSEVAEHDLEFDRFGYLVAATDNEAYNALVCTDFGPHFGRSNVFQLGRLETEGEDRHTLSFTIGGRTLFRSGAGFADVHARLREGWSFQITKLTEEYDYEKFLADREDEILVVLARKPGGRLSFSTITRGPAGSPGDTILSFGPKLARAEPVETNEQS